MPSHELTHASFFSGVGGTDLGLEAAGWKTVSVSEIDPYANAVLESRWPGIPNLGDITTIAGRHAGGGSQDYGPEHALSHSDSRLRLSQHRDSDGRGRSGEPTDERGVVGDWQSATLWSGGFPCQDLSVAGKRAGLRDDDGNLTRSGLAHAFLDLVERYRPSGILLENVPGLLSSNEGRDFGSLLAIMGDLGYWWAYRILDAKYFGVPQRRRRVFIVGIHSESGLGADSAAEILSVGSRCDRHPPKGSTKKARPSPGIRTGLDIAGSLTRRYGKGINTSIDDGGIVIERLAPTIEGGANRTGGIRPPGSTVDTAEALVPSDGLVRRITPTEAERLMGWPDGWTIPKAWKKKTYDIEPAYRPLGTSVQSWRKSARPHEKDGVETWVDDGVANTLNAFDVGDTRTTHMAIATPAEDELLPIGLDSNRYKCCGNGVVAPVAEWIGLRLREAFES